jgi:hypothetical protein
LIAFAEAFDRSFVLKSDLEDMLNMRIPIRMYTDSQSLFDVISKGSMTAERRLQIDIALARKPSLERASTENGFLILR